MFRTRPKAHTTPPHTTNPPTKPATVSTRAVTQGGLARPDEVGAEQQSGGGSGQREGHVDGLTQRLLGPATSGWAPAHLPKSLAAFVRGLGDGVSMDVSRAG